MLTDGLVSSNSVEWYTPQSLVRHIEAEFGVSFATDVCATPESAKCPRFFTAEDDALSLPWSGECWMNPPYGRQIGNWMDKALSSWLDGANVTCLVPARTDTAWWHRTVPYAACVVFLRGRVKFETPEGVATPAPFPSAVVRFADKSKNGVLWGLGGLA